MRNKTSLVQRWKIIPSLFHGIGQRWANLNDERFIAWLKPVTTRNNLITLALLAFIHPVYILIDRSMFMDWYHPKFLGVRLLVSLSALLILTRRKWLHSTLLPFIPITALLAGIPFMTQFTDPEIMISGYSGGALVILAFSLISTLSLKHYILYLGAIYLSCFHIWFLGFSQPFGWWWVEGGFTNYTMAYIGSIVFYMMRLYLVRENYDLVHAVEQKSQKIMEQAQELQTIMDHIPQGICMVQAGVDGLGFDLEPQQAPCFQRKLRQQGFTNTDNLLTFFQSSDLSDDKVRLIENVITSSLNENLIQWELNKHTLPGELQINDESGKKRLIELDWTPISDENELVRKILIILKDVTGFRKQQDEITKKSRDANRILQIISQDPARVRTFFQFAKPIVQELARSNRDELYLSPSFFRNIHTLKGMARTYHLEELIQLFHELEDGIVKHCKTKSTSNQIIFLARRCESTIEEYLTLLGSFFADRSGDQSKVEILNPLLPYAKVIDQALGQLDSQSAQCALKAWRKLLASDISQILADEILMLGNTAQNLDKPIPKLICHATEMYLSEEVKLALRKAFVHLFRNSIDHGIEPVGDRMLSGKAAQGQIKIDIKPKSNGYTLTYSDDGCGLNLNAILHKAIQSGIAKQEVNYQPEHIAQFIFNAGLSTAETCSEYSGRGIGLDAVKEFLNDQECDISLVLHEISSTGFASFSFKIDFPAINSPGGTTLEKIYAI